MTGALLLPPDPRVAPWGRTAPPAPFVAPVGERLGEVWFAPPPPLKSAVFPERTQRFAVQESTPPPLPPIVTEFPETSHDHSAAPWAPPPHEAELPFSAQLRKVPPYAPPPYEPAELPDKTQLDTTPEFSHQAPPPLFSRAWSANSTFRVAPLVRVKPDSTALVPTWQGRRAGSSHPARRRFVP